MELMNSTFSDRYGDIHLVIQRTLRKYFFRVSTHEAFEDLVQESLMGVFEAMCQGRLRDQQKILDFTASVAFYTGCKMLQKKKRTVCPLDECPEPSDRGKSPEEVLLAKERSEQLDRAIAEVGSELDRELLRRCFQGENLHDTRGSLSLSPGQFRNRKSRALKDLAVVVSQIDNPRKWGGRSCRLP